MHRQRIRWWGNPGLFKYGSRNTSGSCGWVFVRILAKGAAKKLQFEVTMQQSRNNPGLLVMPNFLDYPDMVC